MLWRSFWCAHDVPFCVIIFTSRGLKVTESCNRSNQFDSKGGEESISTEVSQRHRNMQVLPLLQFATTVCMLRVLQVGSRKKNEPSSPLGKKRLRCDWEFLLSMGWQKKEAEGSDFVT